MKSTTKGKLKLASLLGCAMISGAASAASIYGTIKILNTSSDYRDQAVNMYRVEKIEELNNAYANGEIDDDKYTTQYKAITEQNNGDLIYSVMTDGSKEVQALLDQADSTSLWCLATGAFAFPATALGTFYSLVKVLDKVTHNYDFEM